MFSRSSSFFRSHVGKRMWRNAQQQTQQQSQKRSMGGGGAYMETNEFGERMGEAFGTVCWLWVFWRFKQDGKVLLGMEHPWDHGHDHGHDGALDQQLRVQGLMNKYSVKAQTEEDMIANWDAFNGKAMNPGDDDDDDEDEDDDDDDDDEDEEEDEDEDDDDE